VIPFCSLKRSIISHFISILSPIYIFFFFPLLFFQIQTSRVSEPDSKRRKIKIAASQQRPVFSGSCPLNRFQIPPGYRWDGLDRSNGFEAKWFLRQNEISAQSVDAYRWSTENM
jgi:hypothetical protein